MPTNLVKTDRDEKLWSRAKARVADEYGLSEADGDRYWKLVNGIYQRMQGKGTKVRLRKGRTVRAHPMKTKTGVTTRREHTDRRPPANQKTNKRPTQVYRGMSSAEYWHWMDTGQIPKGKHGAAGSMAGWAEEHSKFGRNDIMVSFLAPENALRQGDAKGHWITREAIPIEGAMLDVVSGDLIPREEIMAGEDALKATRKRLYAAMQPGAVLLGRGGGRWRDFKVYEKNGRRFIIGLHVPDNYVVADMESRHAPQDPVAARLWNARRALDRAVDHYKAAKHWGDRLDEVGWGDAGPAPTEDDISRLADEVMAAQDAWAEREDEIRHEQREKRFEVTLSRIIAEFQTGLIVRYPDDTEEVFDFDQMVSLNERLRKGQHDEAKHPRYPKGHPKGGQFRDGNRLAPTEEQVQAFYDEMQERPRGFDVEPIHYSEHLHAARTWVFPETGVIPLYHDTNHDARSIVESGLIAGAKGVYAHQAPVPKPTFRFTVEFDGMASGEHRSVYPAGTDATVSPRQAYVDPARNRYNTGFTYYGVWQTLGDVPPDSIRRIRDNMTGEMVYDRDNGKWRDDTWSSRYPVRIVGTQAVYQPVTEWMLRDMKRGIRLNQALRKAHVKAHTRKLKSGKVVQVRAHDDKRTKKQKAPGQGRAASTASAAEEYKRLGVRSAAFKAWFGDWEHDPAAASKVVNEKGEPQETYSVEGDEQESPDGSPVIVYHGSAAAFKSFESGRLDEQALWGPGFYFTESREVAVGKRERVPVYSEETYATLDEAENVRRNTDNPALWRYVARYDHATERYHAVIGEREEQTEPGYAQKGYEMPLDDRPKLVAALRQASDGMGGWSHGYVSKGELESLERDINRFLAGDIGLSTFASWAMGQPYNLRVMRIAFREGLVPEGHLYPVYLRVRSPFDADQALTKDMIERITAPFAEQLDHPHLPGASVTLNSGWTPKAALEAVVQRLWDLQKQTSKTDPAKTREILDDVRWWGNQAKDLSDFSDEEAVELAARTAWNTSNKYGIDTADIYDQSSIPTVREFLADEYVGEDPRSFFMTLHDKLEEAGHPVAHRYRDVLEAAGFDGITHIGQGTFGGGNYDRHRVWIAFAPTQIKAVENLGTFDESTDDIYKGMVRPHFDESTDDIYKGMVRPHTRRSPRAGRVRVSGYTRQNRPKQSGTMNPLTGQTKWAQGYVGEWAPYVAEGYHNTVRLNRVPITAHEQAERALAGLPEIDRQTAWLEHPNTGSEMVLVRRLKSNAKVVWAMNNQRDQIAALVVGSPRDGGFEITGWTAPAVTPDEMGGGLFDQPDPLALPKLFRMMVAQYGEVYSPSTMSPEEGRLWQDLGDAPDLELVKVKTPDKRAQIRWALREGQGRMFDVEQTAPEPEPEDQLSLFKGLWASVKKAFTDPFPGRTSSGPKITRDELVRAVRLAISLEEEAIATYQAQAEASPDPAAKKLLNSIADEERVHVGELQRLLEVLTNESTPFLDGALEAEKLLEKVEKSLGPLRKSQVAAKVQTRRGQRVRVRAYTDRRTKKPDDQPAFREKRTTPRGNTQYLYDEETIAQANAEKFARAVHLAEQVPGILSDVRKALKLGNTPREKVVAAVVALIDRCQFRIGTERYAEQHGTFGVTTLRPEHVTVSGSKVRFRFTGKKQVPWDRAVTDKKLAEFVGHLAADGPGDRLFWYHEGDEQKPIRAADVNAFLRERGVTAKDFRTYHATRAMFEQLKSMSGDEPLTKKQVKANVKTAFENVAAVMGNTPAVCKASYVLPQLVDDYVNNGGRLTLPDWESAAV